MEYYFLFFNDRIDTKPFKKVKTNKDVQQHHVKELLQSRIIDLDRLEAHISDLKDAQHIMHTIKMWLDFETKSIPEYLEV